MPQRAVTCVLYCRISEVCDRKPSNISKPVEYIAGLFYCFTSFLIKKTSDFSGREENFFPFVQNLDNSKEKGIDKLYTGQHSVGRQKIENKLPY